MIRQRLDIRRSFTYNLLYRMTCREQPVRHSSTRTVFIIINFAANKLL